MLFFTITPSFKEVKELISRLPSSVNNLSGFFIILFVFQTKIHSYFCKLYVFVDGNNIQHSQTKSSYLNCLQSRSYSIQ